MRRRRQGAQREEPQLGERLNAQERPVLPELQGRLPIRVKFHPLVAADFEAILTRTRQTFALKTWALKIAKRRGLKKARVALARRLGLGPGLGLGLYLFVSASLCLCLCLCFGLDVAPHG